MMGSNGHSMCAGSRSKGTSVRLEGAAQVWLVQISCDHSL